MSDILTTLREKYPQYKDVPDDKLAAGLISKYPVYAEKDSTLKLTAQGSKIESLVDKQRAQQSVPDPNANSTDLMSAVVNDPMAIPRAIGEKVVQPVMHKIGETVAGIANTPKMMGIGRSGGPFRAGESMLPEGVLDDLKNENAGPMVKGLTGAVSKAVGGLTTPEGVATLPLMEFKAGRVAMAGVMAASTPQQIADTYQVLKDPKATPEKKWEALGDTGIQLAMTTALALGMKPEDITKITPEEALRKSSSITAYTDQALAETRERNTLKVAPEEGSLQATTEKAAENFNQEQEVQAKVEPPKPTAEQLMKEEAANAPKAASHVEDAFAPDAEQVPTKPTFQLAPLTSKALGVATAEKPAPEIVDQTVKNPEVGEAFARIGDYEFGLTRGGLPERPEMYGVGMRRAGSNEPFESGGYGYHTNPESIIERWAGKEAHGKNEPQFSNAKAESIYMGESERIKKANDEAEAKKKEESEASNKKANEWSDYKTAVEGVKLPTGKKVSISVPTAEEGQTLTLNGTQYGEWLISKSESKHDEAPYKVSHVKSGLGMGAKFSTLSQAKNFVKALIHGDVETDFKTADEIRSNNPEFEKLLQITKAWAAGGDIPEYFKDASSEQLKLKGMGGAIPEEFTKPGTFVSNMFAAIDKERAAMGKPPMPETKARTWDKDNTKALARMNADPEWIPNLIQQVKASPRPLLSWENAGMVWQRAKWKSEANNALQRIAQAFDDGRQDDLQQARLDNALYEDKLSELDAAVGRNGTGSEAGRTLQAQKMAAGDDFSLVEMRLQKRAANGGKPLTEAQEKELADLHAKLDETQRAFDQHKAQQQEKISKLEAEAAINRIKSEPPTYHPAIIEAAEKIVGKLEKRADAARERLKARLARASTGLDPTIVLDVAEVGAAHVARGLLDFTKWSERMVSELGEAVKPYLQDAFTKAQDIVKEASKEKPNALEMAREMRSKPPKEQIDANAAKIGEKVKAGKKDEVAWYVQRIARLLVETGVTDREKLIDAVHDILKQSMPDITRRQAMDAISGYGDFKQLTKDQLSVQLRGLKGEMQQIAKLEDMSNGKPPMKSGVERRTPTEAERQLIKKVNEAKFAFQVPMTDPATQLKSALDTYKTSLKNRTADLEDKIARGDYSKTPRRELQLDNEAMRLKAENERVKQKFRQGLIRDRMKQRTPWEKTMDTLVKWRRGFILSGPVTLAKLTSAAIARGIITPAEEAVGAGIGKLFPELANRAPREGGANIKAETKAITEGFTNGMRDAWEVLRKGKSALDLVYKKDDGLPQSFIDIFGNVHGALKAPVKRAEFARSFQKRAEFYAAQGVDVTDEFVQTKIGLEAFQDAERSIFMQKNIVNDAYKRALSRLDQADKKTGKPSMAGKALGTTVRVLMPIVKVPTNIVAETMQYAIGSITGSARLAKAYYDGISELSPEDADLIMRQLKKGTLGGAVLLLGFLNPKVLGGFYQQGQKRDKKDIPPDAARVDGVDIPSYVIHNPWMAAAQIGATVRRVADSKLRKKDSETQGLSHGALAGAFGLAESTPFVREMEETAKAMNPYQRDQWLGELAKSLLVPQALQSTAQAMDKDAQGNPVKRAPKTAIQTIETGIPGLREEVPKK